MSNSKDGLQGLRVELLNASEKSIKDFIAVAKEEIVFDVPAVSDPDQSAEEVAVSLEKVQSILKAKKMALVDGLEMISIIVSEREKISLEKAKVNGEVSGKTGFSPEARRRS